MSALDHLPLVDERSNSQDVEKETSLLYRSRKALWASFKGKDRKRVGVYASLKAIALQSWCNAFLIFLPFAWIAHFKQNEWGHLSIFALCLISTIPLEVLFDFGGEQMALYCGKELGDLVVVSLNNVVEATLAVILLTKCELKLLQSTISGVVLLHLLLVPGMAFLTGGARVWHQNLHPYHTQLNQSLLTLGVLALLIPSALFSGLHPGLGAQAGVMGTERDAGQFLNEQLRGNFLAISRGVAIILLAVYVFSRVYVYNPPGDRNDFESVENIPEELYSVERKLAQQDPKVNPWVCLCMLIVTVGIMAATAEWLVDSIDFVEKETNISKEWFGMILLPLASFSGSATIAVGYFIRAACFLRPEPPTSLAKGQAIDLSIQFTLFWMPFVVLLGWCLNKPLTLLFDLYEISTLIGACFLVNYVTADSKTNWAEGMILCAFYLMIALATWFYKGQLEIHELLSCGSISETLSNVATGGAAALK